MTTKDWEPLEPACAGCKEPRGTCFPGPCRIYWAKHRALPSQFEGPSSVRLEPCPLCTSDKIKAHYIRDGESLGCTECGCRVSAYQPDAGDKCIEKWNRRDGEMTTLRYCEREWQKEREAFFDMIRDKVIAAYIDGATAVHENYQEDRDPDFSEAAHDYYASLQSPS